MSETDSDQTRRRRVAWWIWRVLLGLALALWVFHFIAPLISDARLKAEQARLRSKGEQLKLSDFAPKLAPGEANAAPIYQQAFALLPKEILPGDEPRTWTPAKVARVKKLVAANPRYFELLERASRTPKCVFPKDWSLGINLTFPEFARARDAARALLVRSEVQWREGRIDDAAGSCLTSLRIADHVSQPGMIGHLVSIAIQGISVKELGEVFSAGDPSPATCRALYDELGKRTRLDPVVTAMKAERAWGLSAYDQMLKPDSSSRRKKTLPPTFRFMMSEDKLHYLRTMERTIKSIGQPYPQARAEMRESARRAERFPGNCFIMSSMLAPVGTRFLGSAYRHLALAGAAQIAAAAKGFKSAHGHYPASLEELTKAGWKLPSDPFTRAPYHYAREKQGIAVWSVGPDLVDNHGLDWVYKVNGIEDEAGYRPGFDYVFRCSR